jgi:hypothetical protein
MTTISLGAEAEPVAGEGVGCDCGERAQKEQKRRTLKRLNLELSVRKIIRLLDLFDRVSPNIEKMSAVGLW